MASYVYYDKSGIIRELITADYPARQGMAYDIFMYFDGVDASPTKYNVTCRKPGDDKPGFITTLSWDDATVPYSAERKLSNFEYYRTYHMLHIKVSSLDKGGLWQFTPNIDGKANALLNLFVDSNTNVVDKALSFADYQSLMDKLTELEARIDSLEAVSTASNDAQALDITEEDGVVSIKRT